MIRSGAAGRILACEFEVQRHIQVGIYRRRRLVCIEPIDRQLILLALISQPMRIAAKRRVQQPFEQPQFSFAESALVIHWIIQYILLRSVAGDKKKSKTVSVTLILPMKPEPPVPPSELRKVALETMNAAKFPMFASVDRDQARLRPVSPVKTDGFTVFVASMRSSGKTEELDRNDKVEL